MEPRTIGLVHLTAIGGLLAWHATDEEATARLSPVTPSMASSDRSHVALILILQGALASGGLLGSQQLRDTALAEVGPADSAVGRSTLITAWRVLLVAWLVSSSLMGTLLLGDKASIGLWGAASLPRVVYMLRPLTSVALFTFAAELCVCCKSSLRSAMRLLLVASTAAIASMPLDLLMRATASLNAATATSLLAAVYMHVAHARVAPLWSIAAAMAASCFLLVPLETPRAVVAHVCADVSLQYNNHLCLEAQATVNPPVPSFAKALLAFGPAVSWVAGELVVTAALLCLQIAVHLLAAPNGDAMAATAQHSRGSTANLSSRDGESDAAAGPYSDGRNARSLSELRQEDYFSAEGATGRTPLQALRVLEEDMTLTEDVLRDTFAAEQSTPKRILSRTAGGSQSQVELVRSRWELREMLEEGQKNCWAALTSDHFKVRGPSYLVDRVKQPSATESQLLAVEVFRAPHAVGNIAGRDGAPTATLSARCSHPLHSIFVVVIIIPVGNTILHTAFYFGLYEGFEERCPQAALLLEKFAISDDAFRHEHFKIIPKISDGPFMLKLACPSRPGITGRSGLRQSYHSGPLYYEVDMDTSTSAVANRAISIAKPISKSIVVDMAFLIEGKQEDELPEVLLGCGRIANMDFSDKVVPLLDPTPGSAKS